MRVKVAVLLAIILCSTSADAREQPTESQKVSRELRSICTGLIAWNIDHPPEGEYLEEGGVPGVDFSLSEHLSSKAARAMLVPNYFDKLPELDPWGRPYQLLKNVDPKQSWSWAVRSAGPDGKFCSTSYLVPQPDWDRCDDIARVDGVLVCGPEALEGQ
jgi:hypothetical protein